jgi:hypothetical protein
MLKKKIILGVVTVGIIVSLFTVNMFAKPVKITSDVSTQKVTKVIKEKNELEAFAKENNYPLTNLSEVVIVKTVPNTTTANLKPKSDIAYGWYDWTIFGGFKVNLTRTSECCGTETIRTASDVDSSGPLTCVVNLNLPVICKYINNGGGESLPKLVNDCVGYDVTKEYNINDSKVLNLNANEHGRIIATVYYQIKEFDIFRSPGFGMGYSFDNHGSAQKPIGVCFRVYKW